MGNKYTFKCECKDGPTHIGFSAPHFIEGRSDFLDYLDAIWWEVDLDGMVVAQLDKARWPPELSKRYFNAAARKYAAKVLSGKELIWCGHCECDVVVEKV